MPHPVDQVPGLVIVDRLHELNLDDEPDVDELDHHRVVWLMKQADRPEARAE